MSVTVSIGGWSAVIDDYQWQSESKPLEALLNTTLEVGGPSGSDPNPDLTAAQRAIGLLGGEIVKVDQKDDYVPGGVY